MTSDVPVCITKAQLLMNLIGNSQAGKITVFEGSATMAESAAAALVDKAVAVVGEVWARSEQNFEKCYEYQPTDVMLRMLQTPGTSPLEPLKAAGRLIFAKSIIDVTTARLGAVFVPTGDSAEAVTWLKDKFPATEISVVFCEPEFPGLAALQGFFKSSKFVTGSAVIPRAETRVISAASLAAKVSIRTDHAGQPHLVAI